EELLELEIGMGGLLGARPRRFRHEVVFGPRAEARDVPRQAAPLDDPADARRPPLAERQHPRERLVGEDLLEGRPDGGHRQRVAGEGPADAADVDVLEGNRVANLAPNFLAYPVRA